MRILLLGGTVFLGPALAECAVARGHAVTLFHRGRHPAQAAPGVEVLTGDRNVAADLATLADSRTWDAVIDTCGYFPRQLRAATAALRAHAATYVFISSISVYADLWAAADEDAPLAVPAAPIPDDVAAVTGENYGPLKAACEDAARAAFGDRALAIRAGLIVGPRDVSDRYTYWVRRIARGGDVVAPGDGSRRVQFVDVRDLAEFIVGCVERGTGGTFNVTGEPLRFDEFLGGVARAVAAEGGAHPPATVRWTPEDALLARGIAPWTDLPVWIAGQDQTTGISRARAAGLHLRDPVETARATLAWDRTRDATKPLVVGLTAARETELLAASRG